MTCLACKLLDEPAKNCLACCELDLARSKMYLEILTKQRDEVCDYLDQERSDAFDRGLLIGQSMPRIEDVARAMLEFFTDLSIAVLTDPAPCPYCGTENLIIHEDCDYFTVMCGEDGNCSGAGPMRLGEEREAVREWNKIAVPVAYRRISDGY